MPGSRPVASLEHQRQDVVDQISRTSRQPPVVGASPLLRAAGAGSCAGRATLAGHLIVLGADVHLEQVGRRGVAQLDRPKPTSLVRARRERSAVALD